MNSDWTFPKCSRCCDLGVICEPIDTGDYGARLEHVVTGYCDCESGKRAKLAACVAIAPDADEPLVAKPQLPASV